MSAESQDIPLRVGDEVRVLHVEPGDMVVVELDGDRPPHEVMDIVEWWQDHQPHVPMTVFDKAGIHIVVVDPEQFPWPLACESCQREIKHRPIDSVFPAPR